MDDKLKTVENMEFLCGKFLKSGMSSFSWEVEIVCDCW